MIRIQTISEQNMIITKLDGEVDIYACDSKKEYNDILNSLQRAGAQKALRERLAELKKLATEVVSDK